MSRSDADRRTVAAIVADLKPWRQRWLEKEISHGVAEQLKTLQGAVDEFFDRNAVKRTRDCARDVKKTIAKLRRQLSRASPELKMRLKLPDRQLERRIAEGKRPIGLLDELALAEEECDRAVEGSLTDGRSDQVKKWCATVAHNLIWKYSKKEPTSGSPKAPFRNITGLLYGRVQPSHHKIPDLKRACDDLLRVMRAAVQIAAQNSSEL